MHFNLLYQRHGEKREKVIGVSLKYKVLEKGNLIIITEIRNEIFPYREIWGRRK